MTERELPRRIVRASPVRVHRCSEAEALRDVVSAHRAVLASSLRGSILDVRRVATAPTRSADSVLSSFALCGVHDVAFALAEVLRVLRPGGAFVFLEHVAAPRRTLRRALQRLRALFSRDCDPQRETVAALLAAGFASLEITEVSPSVIVGVGKKGG